jgi:hypothetical protein
MYERNICVLGNIGGFGRLSVPFADVKERFPAECSQRFRLLPPYHAPSVSRLTT